MCIKRYSTQGVVWIHLDPLVDLVELYPDLAMLVVRDIQYPSPEWQFTNALLAHWGLGHWLPLASVQTREYALDSFVTLATIETEWAQSSQARSVVHIGRCSPFSLAFTSDEVKWQYEWASLEFTINSVIWWRIGKGCHIGWSVWSLTYRPPFFVPNSHTDPSFNRSWSLCDWCGKFDDVSYRRNWMHSVETGKHSSSYG